MKKEIIILIFSVLSGFWLSGQEGILGRFTISEVNNKLQVDFAINGGASCNGVDLQRSFDGFRSFEVIDQIQGVCGGSEFVEFYAVQDEVPMAYATNQYRLKLGNVGFSPILEYTFVPLANEYIAYPNPAQDLLTVKFENPEKLLANLEIYSQFGQQTAGFQIQSENSFSIDVSNWNAGVYFFKIMRGDGLEVTGRFIVI